MASFGAVTPVLDVLRLIPGAEPQLIETSCCGMAGSFGYDTNHYEISMRMAELSLLPAVRKQPDAIVVAEVARLEQLRPDERLNPEKLMQDLRLTGKPAAYLPNVDSIVEHVGRESRAGDVVCVFSNGGFGDIHNKLLQRLGAGPGA